MINILLLDVCSVRVVDIDQIVREDDGSGDNKWILDGEYGCHTCLGDQKILNTDRNFKQCYESIVQSCHTLNKFKKFCKQM